MSDRPLLAGAPGTRPPPRLPLGLLTRDGPAGGGDPPPTPAPVRVDQETIDRLAAAVVAHPEAPGMMRRSLAEADGDRITRLEQLLDRAGAGQPGPFRGAGGGPTPAEVPVFMRERDNQALASGDREPARMTIPTATAAVPRGGWMQRSYLTAVDVDGGRVGAVEPWYSAIYSANPFRRFGLEVRNVDGQGSFSTPQLANFTLNAEANLDPTRAKQGNVLPGEVIINNYIAELLFSNAAVQDIPALNSVVMMAAQERAMEVESRQLTALFKASVASATAGTAVDVKTGVADKLPPANMILDVLANMLAAIPAAKRMRGMQGPGWIISPAVERAVIGANLGGGAEREFNPATGVREIHGHPVEVSDHLDSGAAAGDVSALFGNFARAAVGGENNGIVVDGNPYTAPGGWTICVEYRFGETTLEADAVAGLRTAA